MANELTATGGITYKDSESPTKGLQPTDVVASVTTKVTTGDKIVVGTSERAIPLGDVTSCGFVVFYNVGTAGTIYIRAGTGGSRFAALAPGQFAVLPLGPDAQVPYAIATQAACKLDYFLVST